MLSPILCHSITPVTEFTLLRTYGMILQSSLRYLHSNPESIADLLSSVGLGTVHTTYGSFRRMPLGARNPISLLLPGSSPLANKDSRLRNQRLWASCPHRSSGAAHASVRCEPIHASFLPTPSSSSTLTFRFRLRDRVTSIGLPS